ncbi:MAG: hypothetical protein AAFQ98_21195, partial [Bacteroidota bacterium]
MNREDIPDLITVRAGMHVGDFDESALGIEIILNTTFSTPTIGEVRQSQPVLDSPKITGTSSVERLSGRRDRDRVLNYFDAAPFFSAFYTLGLHAFDANHQPQTLKGSGLFADCLAPFQNSQTTYLQIHNGLGLPFNSFDTLGDSLELGSELGGTVETHNYYQEGWPWFRIPSSFFPEPPQDNRHVLQVGLPFGDYAEASWLITSGYRHVAREDTTWGTEPIEGADRFREASWAEGANFTDPLPVAIPHILNGDAHLPMASYISLVFARGLSKTAGAKKHLTPEVEVRHVLDGLFDPFTLINQLPQGSGSSFGFKKIWGETRLLQDEYHLKQPLAAKVGVQLEEGICSFFTQTQNVKYPQLKRKAKSPLKHLTQKVPLADGFLVNSAVSMGGGFFRANSLDTQPSTGSTTPYATLENFHDGRSPFVLPEYSEMVSLSITQAQWQHLESLRTTSGFDTTQRVYLGVRPQGRGRGANGERYQVKELTLIGQEKINQNSQYKSLEVNTGILIHSVGDGLIFTSPQAASYLNPESGLLPGGQHKPLQSKLLSGNNILELINQGKFIPKADNLTRQLPQGEYVEKIQRALKIVIPQLHLIPENAKEWFDRFQEDRAYRADGFLGSKTEEMIEDFQSQANVWENQALGDEELTVDGLLGAQTIRRLDQELQRIFYYDPEKEKMIHHAKRAVPVGAFTVVSNGHVSAFEIYNRLQPTYDYITPEQAEDIREELKTAGYLDENYITTDWVTDSIDQIPFTLNDVFLTNDSLDRFFQGKSGAKLRAEPSTSGEVLKQLRYNDRVRIIELVGRRAPEDEWSFTLEYDWCFVEIDRDHAYSDSEERMRGYVATSLLWTQSEIPDPSAKLYTIEASDSAGLLNLARRFYGSERVSNTTDTNSDAYFDARYYANALLYANNPEGLRTKNQLQLDAATGKYTKAVNVDAAIYLKDDTSSYFSILNAVDPADPTFFGISQPFSLINMSVKYWQTELNQLLGESGTTTSWDAWSHTVVRKNFKIWVPSIEFCEGLRAVINQGDLIRNVWNDGWSAVRAELAS